VVPTKELAKLLISLKQTGGWDNLTELIYNTTGAFNGFDQYGHFGRTLVTLTNCVEYEANPSGASGCVSRFSGTNAATPAETSTAALMSLIQRRLTKKFGGTPAEPGPAIGVGQAGSTRTAPIPQSAPANEEEEGEAGISESSSATEGTEPLLDYLLGP
jgi:hypothetical protein